VTPFEHILVPTIAIAFPLIDCLWVYPWLQRASAAGDKSARTRLYAGWLGMLWLLTAIIAGIWIARGRPWSDLMLGPITPWRVAIGWAIAAAYGTLAVMQWRTMIGKPEHLAKTGASLGKVEALLPHTPGEYRGFMALSVTAGICEEFIYRGFITWYLSQWMPLVAAAAAATLLFAFAHLYQGKNKAVQTGIIGALLAVVVLISGSLAPAMAIHAIQDIVGGDLGYRALTDSED
jgi:membrane protease YdiL (CAAX protease family)